MLSVFEGVVYHCWPSTRTNPCRPVLEVEAVLRDGDADADQRSRCCCRWPTTSIMAGGLDVARPCLRELDAQGRIVEHLGAQHISFPMWTRVHPDAPTRLIRRPELVAIGGPPGPR